MGIDPVVRWAGGKRQLLSELLPRLPKEFGVYFEPFFGGGALCLKLLPSRVVLSDLNCELINMYMVIQSKQVYDFMDILKQHANEEVYYYQLRKQPTDQLNSVERAARFLFLNRTCFNGLWRENSKGHFNVPFGKLKNPTIVDEVKIIRLHNYLMINNVSFNCCDFRESTKNTLQGDFVYFDPPYDNLTKASFTRYNKVDFGSDLQQLLAAEVGRLTGLGVKVMVSNANTPTVRSLYSDYNIEVVNATRAINSQGKGRAKQPIEVIITNY